MQKYQYKVETKYFKNDLLQVATISYIYDGIIDTEQLLSFTTSQIKANTTYNKFYSYVYINIYSSNDEIIGRKEMKLGV